jgi:hypothetical protein
MLTVWFYFLISYILWIFGKFFINELKLNPVSLAQLGERQTEVISH